MNDATLCYCIEEVFLETVYEDSGQIEWDIITQRLNEYKKQKGADE